MIPNRENDTAMRRVRTSAIRTAYASVTITWITNVSPHMTKSWVSMLSRRGGQEPRSPGVHSRPADGCRRSWLTDRVTEIGRRKPGDRSRRWPGTSAECNMQNSTPGRREDMTVFGLRNGSPYNSYLGHHAHPNVLRLYQLDCRDWVSIHSSASPSLRRLRFMQIGREAISRR